MQIDKYKLSVSRFTTELEEPLDKSLRGVILTEIDIYAVEDRDNQDETYDRVYKAKVVGATEVRQGGEKPRVVKGKSKRSLSERWRGAVYYHDPSDEYYERIMEKMLTHSEQILSYLDDL